MFWDLSCDLNIEYLCPSKHALRFYVPTPYSSGLKPNDTQSVVFVLELVSLFYILFFFFFFFSLNELT